MVIADSPLTPIWEGLPNPCQSRRGRCGGGLWSHHRTAMEEDERGTGLRPHCCAANGEPVAKDSLVGSASPLPSAGWLLNSNSLLPSSTREGPGNLGSPCSQWSLWREDRELKVWHSRESQSRAWSCLVAPANPRGAGVRSLRGMSPRDQPRDPPPLHSSLVILGLQRLNGWGGGPRFPPCNQEPTPGSLPSLDSKSL